MKKPKVHVVLFLENDEFYNTLHYSSKNKKALDDIRKDLNTNGDVWDKESSPLTIRPYIKKFPEYYNNFFIFRTLHDNENNIPVEISEAFKLVLSYIDGVVDNSFYNHSCRYVSLIAQNIKKYRECYDITVEVLNSPRVGV